MLEEVSLADYADWEIVPEETSIPAPAPPPAPVANTAAALPPIERCLAALKALVALPEFQAFEWARGTRAPAKFWEPIPGAPVVNRARKPV